MKNVSLKTIGLPDFGIEGVMPEIPVAEFESRITKAQLTMRERQLDFLLVFADREHFANFRYLTHLDPRFEEAMLLLDIDGKRKILFGNECFSAGGKAPIPFEYELFQDFSLLGQSRSGSRPLKEILENFGIAPGKKVGCAYYKYYPDRSGKSIPDKLDIPAFLADLLRELCAGRTQVTNANDLFMNAAIGLRNNNCLEELVRFEWASVRSSESMKRMIREIKPGKREYELANFFQSDGLPYSCHPMLSSGEKAKVGLSSPSPNKVVLGDAFTSAFGVWGALTCRAGMVAAGPDDLKKPIADFFEKFWRNYFHVVATWYETVGIGVKGDEVMQQVEAARDKSLFDFALNAGHTIHLDEWVDSPFYFGSEVKLYSGMALQMDIIPANTKEFVAANSEDGVVLADESLRTRWAREFPVSWKRIEMRREFMIKHLGINLKPEVLPLSNIPAYYNPYLLSPNRVATLLDK